MTFKLSTPLQNEAAIRLSAETASQLNSLIDILLYSNHNSFVSVTMDPASIIGTTSAAITFVETLAKIVSVARKVHRATDELDEHKRLRDAASALEPAITALIDKSKNQTPLSPVEKSLLEVAKQCQDVSNRIIHLMDSYQVGPVSHNGNSSPSSEKSITGLSSVKKSMKVTFRIIRGEREEEGLRQDFDRCNRLLNIHLELIFKSKVLEKIDAVFVKYRQEASAEFESIRDTLQTTLVDIHQQSEDLVKQVNFMKVTLDEVAGNDSHWLQQISKLQKLFETSHQTIEQIKNHQILKAIAFHDMRMRHHQIANVELAEKTFEWMVKDETVPASQPHLKQSFTNWLKDGEGIFHITGKPGSGKSTMMNLLASHPDTRKHLEKWARNGNRIIIASMFLWNPGSVQQKSVDGVYRTLLYTILNDQKELIPHLFSDLWNASSEELPITRQYLEISRKEIEAALQKLITDSTQGYQYCFFIDGLDEIKDESKSSFRFSTELCNWARCQNVKLCLSSREQRPWTSYFEGFPKLKIHLTTKQDIRRMIDNYLLHDRHLKTFPAAERERFVSRFVGMAEGVFIWVKLVLRELEESLNYELPLSTLYHVLDTFPRELDEFYDSIMCQIPKREKSLADAVFDVIIETHKWPMREIFNIRHHVILRDVISCPDIYQLTSKHMAPQAFDPIEDFRKVIPWIFRGMVEVVQWRREDPDTDFLTFSHRSVYEYLSTGSKHRSPRSKVDTLKMVVQCLIAKANFYEFSKFKTAVFLDDLLPEIEQTHDNSILPLLGSLDETLLRRQSKQFQSLAWNFHSSSKFIPFGEKDIEMVFFRSCKQRFYSYVRWAIRNTPYWRDNELFRASAIAFLSSPDTYIYPSPGEALKILLSDEFGPNFWYTHPSFPCPISPWTRFLFYIIGKRAHRPSRFRLPWPDRLWQVLGVFIDNKADLDLLFSWTLQKTSTYPRRFYIKDIRVGNRVQHDSQYPKTDALFYKGKKFYVSREFRMKFPRGGSAREIVAYFAPEEYLALLC
ncbi:Ff.00g114010.m01.CDS01 [Fusarium sp. VM40]|nr:Ff.00g114010.m01.CDS01 [Fusarium sp. VM40]